MGAEQNGIEPGRRAAAFDNQIDRLWRQSLPFEAFPAIGGAKNRPFRDVGALEPFAQRIDRRADQQYEGILARHRRLGAAQCDFQAAKERRVRIGGVDGDGRFAKTCSQRSAAISPRRRPPEPKATLRSARSRQSASRSVWQVASNWSRMARLMARRLLRRRGRELARTAACKDGLANGPSTPRQRCSVLQLASRRLTVAGACGPSARKRSASRKTSGTSFGMPWAEPVSR
jgi:hypothetical protein